MSGTRRKPGRLSAHVDGYRAHLLKAGHAPLSVTRSLTSLGHLGRWMERNGLGVEQLDDRAITAFLADHIRDHGHRPTAGVLPLVTYLRVRASSHPNPRGRRRRSIGCSLITASGCFASAGWRVSATVGPVWRGPLCCPVVSRLLCGVAGE